MKLFVLVELILQETVLFFISMLNDIKMSNARNFWLLCCFLVSDAGKYNQMKLFVLVELILQETDLFFISSCWQWLMLISLHFGCYPSD